MSFFTNLLSKFKNGTNEDPSVKRRFPRISLHPKYCHFESQQNQIIKIVNISEAGLALCFQQMTDLRPLDSLEGVLHLHENECDIELMVIHVTPPIIGCEFIYGHEQIAKVLWHYHKNSLLAHGLKKIQSQVLAAKEGTPYYYYGSNKEELYFVYSHKEIHQFSLMFDGHYITGGAEQSLRIGRIKIELKQSVQDPGALSPIDYYDDYDQKFIDEVVEFLNNIEYLDSGHLKALITKIKA